MQSVSDSDDSDRLTIAKTICKIGKIIKDMHKRGEDTSSEIEQLQGNILGENAFAALVACQTFVELYESLVIDMNRVTALFLPILQNSRLIRKSIFF